MPYAINDIVQVTMTGISLNETTRNVFHYRVTDANGSTTAQNLLEAFQNAVVAPLMNILSVDTEVRLLEIDNLTDGLSFGELPLFSVEGNVAGSVMPSYVVVGYKLLRSSKITRNGFKRFSGVVEADVTGNLMTSTFVNSAANQAVIDALGSEIVTGQAGVAASMFPVILGRRPGQTPPFVTQDVAGVELQRNITSQNSRKPGRGE